MEYKFGGKRTDNGEWVYGNLVYMHGRGDTWTTGIQQPSGDGFRPFGSIPVDIITVRQYIGREDKYNKEIYTKDYVKITVKFTMGIETSTITIAEGVVEYRANKISDLGCGFGVVDKRGTFNYLSSFAYNCEIEKLGNIFDNPELLEVAEDDNTAGNRQGA